MSYDIIKQITITNNEVFINSACNNVSPKNYNKWQALDLSKILQENGKDAVTKEILFHFWNGNFQGKSTIYGRFNETYINDKYSWDNTGKKEEVGTKKFNQFEILYSYDEVKDDLLNKFKEYKTRSKNKQLFLVTLNSCYISKLCRRKAFTTKYKDCAKKFNLIQVEDIQRRFSNYEINFSEV